MPVISSLPARDACTVPVQKLQKTFCEYRIFTYFIVQLGSSKHYNYLIWGHVFQENLFYFCLKRGCYSDPSSPPIIPGPGVYDIYDLYGVQGSLLRPRQQKAQLLLNIINADFSIWSENGFQFGKYLTFTKSKVWFVCHRAKFGHLRR